MRNISYDDIPIDSHPYQLIAVSVINNTRNTLFVKEIRVEIVTPAGNRYNYQAYSGFNPECFIDGHSSVIPPYGYSTIKLLPDERNIYTVANNENPYNFFDKEDSVTVRVVVEDPKSEKEGNIDCELAH